MRYANDNELRQIFLLMVENCEYLAAQNMAMKNLLEVMASDRPDKAEFADIQPHIDGIAARSDVTQAVARQYKPMRDFLLADMPSEAQKQLLESLQAMKRRKVN